MRIECTKLDGLYLIPVDIHRDNRGYNLSAYHKYEYTNKILTVTNTPVHFVEHNLSFSTYGVLRGLHYDSKRWKLCHCLSGKVFYAAVNVETGEFQYLLLDNTLQVLKAPHLAHGFQVITDSALFHYMTSDYYNPNREKIYPWNGYGIEWPIKPPILSEKDARAAI